MNKVIDFDTAKNKRHLSEAERHDIELYDNTIEFLNSMQYFVFTQLFLACYRNFEPTYGALVFPHVSKSILNEGLEVLVKNPETSAAQSVLYFRVFPKNDLTFDSSSWSPLADLKAAQEWISSDEVSLNVQSGLGLTIVDMMRMQHEAISRQSEVRIVGTSMNGWRYVSFIGKDTVLTYKVHVKNLVEWEAVVSSLN